MVRRPKSGSLLHQVLRIALVVAAVVMLAGCPVYYELIAEAMALAGHQLGFGDIQITITLRDVAEPLVCNQAHMSTAASGAPEYSWGVEIDIDDDPATGDPEGFDVTISAGLQNGGDLSMENDLTTSMQALLSLLTVEPQMQEWDRFMSTHDRPIGLLDSTLHISSDSDNDVLVWGHFNQVGYVTPSPTLRARFYARWNNPPDNTTVVEDTAEVIGEGTETDPTDDANPGWLDIIEVSLILPESGGP